MIIRLLADKVRVIVAELFGWRCLGRATPAKASEVSQPNGWLLLLLLLCVQHTRVGF